MLKYCHRSLIYIDMSKKYLGIISGVILIAVIMVVMVLSQKKNQGEIKIGFFGPLSGDTAAYGEPSLRGLTMAVEELNKKGGIDGKNIAIVAEDSKCSGKDAVSAVTKLIDVDHVEYLIGGSCSGEVLAVASIVKEKNILIFSPFASSPQIAGTGVFRVVPSDALAGPFMAGELIKDYKNMAIISEKTEYALGLKNELTKSYESEGGTIVSNESFDTNTSDFRSLLQKVKMQNPDLIFLNPQSGAAGARLAKQAREMGITTPFAAFFITGEDFTSEPAAEGTIVFDIPSLAKNSSASTFIANYESKYGKPS
jgi:branched-chain amino acid transport system substrate-binding protein